MGDFRLDQLIFTEICKDAFLTTNKNQDGP